MIKLLSITLCWHGTPSTLSSMNISCHPHSLEVNNFPLSPWLLWESQLRSIVPQRLYSLTPTTLETDHHGNPSLRSYSTLSSFSLLQVQCSAVLPSSPQHPGPCMDHSDDQQSTASRVHKDRQLE